MYKREGNKRCEYRVKAVDVVDANDKFIRTGFNGKEECIAYTRKAIGNSDLIINGISRKGEKVWGFATCSYQTRNSRTIVYVSAED